MAFQRPSPGRITQFYSASHRGYDYGWGNGLQVYAAEAGEVAAAREVDGYGNRIVINHGNGLSTRYAHLSSMFISPGDRVVQGQRIGSEGATGSFADGVHLHFEVLINGVKVDPGPYFSSSSGGGITPIPDPPPAPNTESIPPMPVVIRSVTGASNGSLVLLSEQNGARVFGGSEIGIADAYRKAYNRLAPAAVAGATPTWHDVTHEEYTVLIAECNANALVPRFTPLATSTQLSTQTSLINAVGTAINTNVTNSKQAILDRGGNGPWGGGGAAAIAPFTANITPVESTE